MSQTVDRFRGVLRSLLEKSRKGEVRWEVEKSRRRRSMQEYADLARQPEQSRNEDDYPSTFVVRFKDPNAKISVAYVSPTTAPDFARAEFVVDGKIAAFLEAEDGGNLEDFELLCDLWQDAQRSVHDWDKALDQVERALHSEGIVGAAPMPVSG